MKLKKNNKKVNTHSLLNDENIKEKKKKKRPPSLLIQKKMSHGTQFF